MSDELEAELIAAVQAATFIEDSELFSRAAERIEHLEQENAKLRKQVMRAVRFGYKHRANPTMHGASMQACIAAWHEAEEVKG